MIEIKKLRILSGLTQQEMAKNAGTSQATLAQYENGQKSPSLSTLTRLAETLGFSLSIKYAPPLTREDQRSLALHTAIAQKLRKNPKNIVNHAKEVLKKFIHQHPFPNSLFTTWEKWLELPIDELITNFLDTGYAARDMRQVTPFTRVLTARERLSIIKKFREKFGDSK